MITLKQYTNEQNQILSLIQGFWKVHSNYAQSEAEAIEAAARNEAAIRLYRKMGYNYLNTITLRKDFPGYEF